MSFGHNNDTAHINECMLQTTFNARNWKGNGLKWWRKFSIMCHCT